MFAFATGFMLIVGWLSEAEGRPKNGLPWVRAVMLGLAGGVAVVSVAAFAMVLHAAALLLVLLLGGSAPPVVAWYVRILRIGDVRGQSNEYAAVSTSQLCREWRESYVALNQAPTASARVRIVMARHLCLQELERRDPDGLQAWLSSAASAGGDPSRFLTDRPTDNPPAST
ncbi:hypothetical protein ACIBL3_29540 [Kribbella sp. NPDC050124]|uniref:hypothetical protein n=1 Tax=Kribbella sp. NPDC050124 TaxID=3364114 RepID=UPI00379CC02E